MSSTTTPHKSKARKASARLFRSPKPAFGLSPARPLAPATTETDVVLTQTEFQWGKSDAGSIASVDSSKSKKHESSDIQRVQQTHARSVSSTSTPSSQGNEPPYEQPTAVIAEANPVSEISARAGVESIHDTPSITSSQMTALSDTTTQNASLADTQATSIIPPEAAPDVGATKTRSRSPSVKSASGTESRSNSPSIHSASRSNSPSPVNVHHDLTPSWDNVAMDSSVGILGQSEPRPEQASEPAPPTEATGSSSATPAARFSPSPEPIAFVPTIMKATTAALDSLPMSFPSNLSVPESGSGTPDPRSPLTYRPRRSFSQRGKSDFDLYSKRPGLARIKAGHRRALSQDSPGTADDNKRNLDFIPEITGAGSKTGGGFTFSVPPPVRASSGSPPPPRPSAPASGTTSRRASVPTRASSPPVEHVGDTFGPMRCHSPEPAEVEAPKQIDEALNSQSDKSFEHSSGPGSSIVIVPSPTDVPLPDDGEDGCSEDESAPVPVPSVARTALPAPPPVCASPPPVAPIAPIPPVAPILPAVPAPPVTSVPVAAPVCLPDEPKVAPGTNIPIPVPAPRDVEKCPEPQIKKPSLGQAAILPIAAGVIGAGAGVGTVFRAGTTQPRKDTVPTPPAIPREPLPRDTEKQKSFESRAACRVKQPSIMDLVEIATFRGQLSIVFSWLENKTFPLVNTSAGLSYLYLTDQSPGFNVSLSKSRGAKRTAFENVVTKTYTLEFTGATHSVLRAAMALLVSSLTAVTYAYMWGWL